MNNKTKHTVLILDRMRVERTYTGGRLLDEWQGICPGHDSLKPEEWVASSTPSRYAPDPNTGLSKIRSGQHRGRLLKDYISEDPSCILGKKHYAEYGENLGFLTKIIDSDKRLNIQTHPDRVQAKILFDSDFGKSEAWYVMGGRTIDGEEPYILMGFKPGMTREIWVDLVEKQNINAMEESLHKVSIQKGDVFIIPSGMPHAIGSGCMIAEIQEPTDITFRVEKISHPGKTYLEETYHQGVGYEKMFDCFDYTGLPLDELLEKTRVYHDSKVFGDRSFQTPLINSKDIPYYGMEKIELMDHWNLNNSEGFAVVVILDGKGNISHKGKTFDVEKSNEIFLPCSNEIYSFESNDSDKMEFLICYPPDREF